MNKITEFFNSVGTLDTETTGTKSDDDIIQLSILMKHNSEDNYFTTLYKPNKLVPAECSAIHFISDEDLVDAPTFAELAEPVSMLIDGFSYLIAHNSEFDRQMLANNYNRYHNKVPSNILDKTKWICTFKLAKKLFGQETENFKNMQLSYLWFKFGLNKYCTRKITPHDAQDDVYMCFKVLEHITNEFINRGEIDPNRDIGEQLYKICNTPCILEIYPYGKYKGTKFKDVVEKDMRYIEWMVKTSDLLDENSTSFDADFAATIEYYVN